jgi:hypothetical protein
MSVALATLLTKFVSEGDKQLVDTLDKVTDKSDKAAKATADLTRAQQDHGKAANDAAAKTSDATAKIAEHGRAVSATSERLKDGAKTAGDFGKAIASGKLDEAAGHAARLAASFGPLATGFTVVSLAAVKAGLDTYKLAQEMRDLDGISRGLGAAMGLSGQAIKEAAAVGAAASHQSIQAAQEQARVYAQTGAVTATQIEGLIGLTQRYSLATGSDAKEATQSLAKAMADPARGAEEMAQSLGILNGAQVDYIKNLAAAGDKTSAQAALQSALNDNLATAETRLNLLADAWTTVKNAAVGAYEKMLDAVNVAAGGGTQRQQIAHLLTGPMYGGVAGVAFRDQAVAAAQTSLWDDLARSARTEGNKLGLTGNTVIGEISGQSERDALNSRLDAAKQRAALINPADIQATKDAATAVQALEHATRTYLAPEEKRIELAEKDAAIAHARTAQDYASVRRLTSEREAISLSGEVITDAGAARLAGLTGDSARVPHGAQNQFAVDLATAARDELQARRGLVKGLEDQLAAQIDEIQAGVEAAKAAIEQKVKRHELTRGQADQIEAVQLQTGVYKELTAEAATALAIAERDIANRNAIAGFTQRELAARASMATTAADASAFEAQALTARQELERADLKQRYDAQIAGAAPAEKDRLRAEEATRLAALDGAQAAEKTAQLRTAQSRAVQEGLAVTLSGIAADRSLLDSQLAMARTGIERRHIAEQQLADDQKAEHAASLAALSDPKSSPQALAAARAALATEAQRFGNQLRGIDVDAWAIDFHDAQSAIAQFTQGLQQDDWVTAFQGLSKAFDQFNAAATAAEKFSVVTGVISGVGQAIGGAAGSAISRAASAAEFGMHVAGPEGAVIAAAASAIGSLLSGNKVIGEVRLSAKDQQALQATGSVLGSVNAQSASIAESLATAERYQDRSLDFSSQQVRYLKDISGSLGALSDAIGRQISVSGAFSTAGLGLGSKSSASLWAGPDLRPSSAACRTTTTTSLVDQGINLGSGPLAAYLSGAFGGGTYQDTQSVKPRARFLGLIKNTTTTNSELTGALDAQVTGAVAGVVSSLSKGVLQAAGQIGLDGAQAVLDSFQVNLGRISLDGLSADQVSAQLSAVFSKLGDQLAGAVAPSFADLQKAGEGMLQTLERLATEYSTVDTSLAAIGKTFGAVGSASVAARDALVQALGGLDSFTSELAAYQQEFLTDAEQLAPVQDAGDPRHGRAGLCRRHHQGAVRRWSTAST